MTPAAPRPLVPSRIAVSVVALGIPLLTTTLALVIAHSWRPELPELIATGWGPDGVRETGAFGPTVWGLAALALVFAVGLWAIAFFWGRAAMTRRFAAGFAVGLGIFVPGLLLVMLQAQRGLAPGQEPVLAGGVVTGVVLGALAAGAVAAWLLPGDPPQPAHGPVPDDAPRLPLGEAEHAAWVRSSGRSGAPWIVAGAALLLLTLGFATRDWLLAAVITLPVALLVAALTRWTVTVSRAGLVARPGLPLPRMTIPIEEIESAEVGAVRAVREFGGWGLRVGQGGRTGLILRSGEAIVIHRTGGRETVITIDDAATAVALLNSLAARTR